MYALPLRLISLGYIQQKTNGGDTGEVRRQGENEEGGREEDRGREGGRDGEELGWHAGREEGEYL